MIGRKMKKQYIPLKIEVLPLRVFAVLCASGGSSKETFGTDGPTGGSQGSGRAPRRPGLPPF